MRTNYGICIRVWVYRPMLRYICYYSTLMTAFLQAKKHRNTPQARLRPTSPALRATSPCRGGFGIPQSFPSSPEAPLPGATATTAASGGNREELLGPRPAGCEARTKGRSRRWEPQPEQWHRGAMTERLYFAAAFVQSHKKPPASLRGALKSLMLFYQTG